MQQVQAASFFGSTETRRGEMHATDIFHAGGSNFGELRRDEVLAALLDIGQRVDLKDMESVTSFVENEVNAGFDGLSLSKNEGQMLDLQRKVVATRRFIGALLQIKTVFANHRIEVAAEG